MHERVYRFTGLDYWIDIQYDIFLAFTHLMVSLIDFLGAHV